MEAKEYKEHRRKSKRYPVRWKTAVVFDKTQGKPTLHTQTLDLSAGGAAIACEYEDLAGTTVTLLLAQPAPAGEPPRMLRVRAKVVSSNNAKKPHVRHGLSFLRGPDDGLDQLEELLKVALASQAAAQPAAAPAPAAAAPASATADSPIGGATTSRLATLRAMAQQKLTEAPKVDPMAEARQRLEESLQLAYKYFKELTEQLNIVKPEYRNRGYVIDGVPEFGALAWESGYADLRTREIGKDKKQVEGVSLYFKVCGSEKQCKVVRAYPASDKIVRALGDYQLEYKATEKKNAKGSLEQVTFFFPWEIAASLMLTANYDTCRIEMRTKNVERFGVMKHEIAPESVTEASLEELTGYILAETAKPGALVQKA